MLHDLHEEETRFNELERSTGASSRTPSRGLDDLEDADLVNRRVEDHPVVTYYSVTDRGGRCVPSGTNSNAGPASG